jgi:hypothetical protein
MEMLVEHPEQAPAGQPSSSRTQPVARPFAALVATGTEPVVDLGAISGHTDPADVTITPMRDLAWDYARALDDRALVLAPGSRVEVVSDRPFDGTGGTYTVTFEVGGISYAVMALLAGYTDLVEMLVDLEPHIVRGDQ